MRPHHNQSGYTVLQLLLAMAAILLLMTWAIPHLERQRIRANETEALASLRMLNQMEGQYHTLFPAAGYACSTAALGGNPKLGPSSPTAAQLIPDDLARGEKAGYIFRIGDCTVGKSAPNPVITYRITAKPAQPGYTGRRGFCTDESTQFRVDPDGNDRCTEPLE